MLSATDPDVHRPRRVHLDQRAEPERDQVVLVPQLLRRALGIEVPGVAPRAAGLIPSLRELARAPAPDLDQRPRCNRSRGGTAYE